MLRKFIVLSLLLCGLALRGAVIPKQGQTLALSAGWNLVILQGTPTQLKRQELQLLIPWVYDAADCAYIICTEQTSLHNGSVVWLWSATARTVELAFVQEEAKPEPPLAETGWSFVGASSDAPAWLSQASRIFLWDARQFYLEAAQPMEGQGAWANRE